jgi:hypothetical protein
MLSFKAADNRKEVTNMYKMLFSPLCLIRGLCMPALAVAGVIVAAIAYITQQNAETGK